MTDRPIIFSAPMVRALLAGRKSQTRKLATSPLRRSAPGDRLYVREGWWIATRYSYGTTPGGDELSAPPLARRRDPVHYAAAGDPPNCANRHYGPEGLRGGWFAAPDPYAVWHRKPSIHMPRWASRLTLIVEEVRVEPLQAISEADAIAEGLLWRAVLEAWAAVDIDSWPTWTDPRRSYCGLWNHLHTKPGERWEDNPLVVALTFRVEQRNIDAGEGA